MDTARTSPLRKFQAEKWRYDPDSENFYRPDKSLVIAAIETCLIKYSFGRAIRLLETLGTPAQHIPMVKIMNIGYREVNKTERTSDYRAYLQLWKTT